MSFRLIQIRSGIVKMLCVSMPNLGLQACFDPVLDCPDPAQANAVQSGVGSLDALLCQDTDQRRKIKPHESRAGAWSSGAIESWARHQSEPSTS